MISYSTKTVVKTVTVQLLSLKIMKVTCFSHLLMLIVKSQPQYFHTEGNDIRKKKEKHTLIHTQIKIIKEWHDFVHGCIEFCTTNSKCDHYVRVIIMFLCSMWYSQN